MLKVGAGVAVNPLATGLLHLWMMHPSHASLSTCSGQNREPEVVSLFSRGRQHGALPVAAQADEPDIYKIHSARKPQTPPVCLNLEFPHHEPSDLPLILQAFS
jgi:hypothetical protein